MLPSFELSIEETTLFYSADYSEMNWTHNVIISKTKSIDTLHGAAVAEWLSSWLAEQEDRGSIPGLATWIFRDWLSPASKSRYGWKIAKSTLILKNNQQQTTTTTLYTAGSRLKWCFGYLWPFFHVFPRLSNKLDKISMVGGAKNGAEQEECTAAADDGGPQEEVTPPSGNWDAPGRQEEINWGAQRTIMDLARTETAKHQVAANEQQGVGEVLVCQWPGRIVIDEK